MVVVDKNRALAKLRMQGIANAADIRTVAQCEKRKQRFHGVLNGVNRAHVVKVVLAQVFFKVRIEFEPKPHRFKMLYRGLKRMLAQHGLIAHPNLFKSHHLRTHLEAAQFGEKTRHRARAQLF